MSLQLHHGGHVVQNCWVVSDIQRAMLSWIALGIGPFLTFDVAIPKVEYRGTTTCVEGHYALAQAGDLQIELVQPLGDRPSAFRDMFAPGTGGFHHVLKTCVDWDAEIAALRANDVEMATVGNHNGIRFAYADMCSSLGCMLELVEDGPLFRSICRAVKDAATEWVGEDPIRPLLLD